MSKQKCSFVVLFVLFFSTIFLSSSVSASTYTASLSTSGTVNLNVSASGNGANVTSDSLSIISTCPSGYNVSIEGPTDSTLYKNGNSSNNSATQKILASSGTRNNPVSILGNNVKTWGYTTESINGSSPITTSSNFVGLTDTITNIFSSNSATSSTGTTLPVYYGASVDSTIEPGLYTMAESSSGANDNKITYYLTTALSCTSYTVNFSPTSTAGGQTISGTGTMNPQTISEGTATTLTANAYTAPSGYYFAGWNTAQDGTGTHYSNQQQVTDLTTAGNSITLYAEWTDCQPGRICYNDNGANSATTMGNQTVSSSATSVTLWVSNYQRANYGFAGWNTKADGTGTNYGPNEDIENAAILTSIQERGLKLYAKWIQSQGNLQDWQGCSSMSSGAVTALKDTRDNQVYAVAKLADGKCWMIENLRLNNTATHNTDGSLAQGYGGVFAGLANPESANFSSNTTANSLYYSGTQSGTATINIGTNDAYIRFPRFNNQNTSSPVSRMISPTSRNIYSYGNFYTWPAALANTNDYTSPTAEVDGKTSETANTSICPSGWKLPYGRNTGKGATVGGFSKLDIGLGGTGSTSSSSTTPTGAEMSKLWRKYPNNFIYSGFFSDSSSSGEGRYGFYWSSTANSGEAVSHYLDLRNTGVNPGTLSFSKYQGISVRCLIGDSYQVAFNPTSTAGGQTISGTGTMGNQTIFEGATTTLAANSFIAPSGYFFTGWNTAQDGTGTHYNDQQQITDLTTAGNSITLYAQWDDCLSGRICYDDNGANSQTTMGDQSVSSTATSVTLRASNFQRSNYGFAGWNTSADGTGTNYGPNETIDDSTTLAAIQSTGLKLYAMWKEPAKDNNNNVLTFQTNNLLTTTLSDGTTLNSKSNGYITALKDERDNQVYAIAKLADGKYWMIENLRLNNTAAHNTDGTLAQGYSGVFAGLATPETANFSDNTTANSLYYSGTQSGTATIDIGTTNPGSRMPRFNNQNSSSPVSNMTSTNSNVYSYGNYYTWSAALANTNNYTGPTTQVNSKTSETVNTSICPSGWRLPYGRNTGNGATAGGFSKLDKELGGTGAYSSSSTTPTGAEMSKLWRKYPNNFILSGYLNSSSALGRGSNGYYWSSTAYGSIGSYYLTFGSSTYVYPGTDNYGKRNGTSVRCVAGS